MRKTEQVEAWVVYRMTLKGKQEPVNAVCDQAQWDALQVAQPGCHTLIKEGIASEGEAERLARGTSGDRVSRGLLR